MSARPRAASLARLTIATALTAFVLWKSHPSAVAAAIARTDLWWIAATLVLVVIDRALMAYRWLVLLAPIEPDRRPSLGVVMRIFFVSTFVGTFLPASVGGDAVRAYSLARHEVPGTVAAASVIMDRALGVLSLLTLAVVSLILARNLVTDAAVLASLAVTTAACGLLGLFVFSTAIAERGRRLLNAVRSDRMQRLGAGLIDAFQRYARHHGALANVYVSSVAVQLLRIVQAYCLGVAMGIDASIGIYIAFIPLILLVMLLPVTVNGIGTSQAAFVWFFGSAGVARADAFALSVLFVALGIVGNLPGGVLYVLNGFRTGHAHEIKV